jgi:cytochrome c-type biogenesis protein CcmH
MFVASLALGWPLAAGYPADQAAAPLTSSAFIVDIEESLVCQCGCGLTVHSCNHLNCPSAIPMKKEIGERLARGETKEQVIAYYHDRYGEKVLSSPTLTGFNLAAWIAPFVALVIGGGVITRVARRWIRETGQPAPVAEGSTATDDKYRDQLAREIDEFDG